MIYPTVTIIIPTKNNEQTIDSCIKSIMSMDYPREKLELIVVDAFSKDRTLHICARYPVKVLRKNCNAPAAYNIALRDVSSEIIGFIDGDAKVTKDWLRNLVQHLNDLNVAGAGGMIMTWNCDNLIPRFIGYDITNRYEKMPKSITRIATTNLILKKKVIDEVGRFDEALATGYDADIGYKIVKKGYKIIFEPKAVVYHFHRPNLNAYFRQQYIYAKNDVALYLKTKGLIFEDTVTNLWMIIQPLMLFTSGILLVLGVMLQISLIIGGALFLLLLFVYLISGVKLAMKYHDLLACMGIPLVYVTRCIAWTIGACVSAIKLLFSKK